MGFIFQNCLKLNRQTNVLSSYGIQQSVPGCAGPFVETKFDIVNRSPSVVILSEAKDPCIPARVNTAKYRNMGRIKHVLRFFAGPSSNGPSQNDNSRVFFNIMLPPCAGKSSNFSLVAEE